MQYIRTYSTEHDNQIFVCSVFYEPDEDSLDLPFSLKLVASISPDYTPEHLKDPLSDAAIVLLCKSDVPLDVRIKEMEHFLNVLKTMYYA